MKFNQDYLILTILERLERQIALLQSGRHHDEELPIYETKQNRNNNEAQSARSGYFSTLPKRLKVDKFKHRFGSKAQKYR